MKIFHIFFSVLLAVCVPWVVLKGHGNSFVGVSANASGGIDAVVPSEAKGFKKIVQWGLAKVEKAFDRKVVSEMISSFLQRCDSIIKMMITNFTESMTMSYKELRDREEKRIADFDVEFKELVNLRNKIERRCLYPSTGDDRSLCVGKGIEIKDKITDLRKRREKATNALEKYESAILWCKSYNNWFC
mmetsp:Transcript_4992/g.7824  ORF Transcript_4992/g.7824 Transcript_4992/m.7824 type:complete len:188 (+) Transcript_4992:114-677(+)